VGVDGSGTVFTQTGDSVIAYNVASSGGGAYVRQHGHVTLVGGRVISNTATHSGGGMSVSQGSVTWLDGQVAGNTAGFYGGGMYLSQGTVAMDGGQIVSNTAGRRGGGMYIVSDSAFTQTGASLIAHNAISDTGTDGYGGGIYFGGGRATLEGGQIVSNTAVRYGGGVYIGSGDVTLHRGQILSNTALLGGGLYNNGGTLTLLNTTVSGNTATTDYGGLCNNSGTSILTFSTVASNTAASQVGGIRAASAVLVQNSLVAHNAPINCSGTFTSTGHNLDSGTSCGFSATSDITDTAPLIGPLDGDGAHPLLEGSPAIDKGLCLPGVTTDQRGAARPQGSACDIGAYEFGVSHQIYLPLVLRD
jgi:hypothetical protein